MNLDKLNKQLRRDLAANPKKGAALGLMVLVALYFWGPLVWKWTMGGPKSATKANMASLILTDDPAGPSQQTKSRGGAKFRWEKVRQLMQTDPRMAAAKFEVAWIDPFAKALAIAPEQPIAESPMADVALASPESAEQPDYGFVLTSVLIGPRSRAAVVNGEPCREGDLVQIPDKNDKTVTRQVRVLEIRRRSVVLEVEGQRVIIEQYKPQVAHGDQIERHTGKDRN